ncbi:MAG TPA: hypothetical protein VGA22_12060 [Gemmatimonadales bacterium]|jgi:hypothetical protein
MHKVQVWAELTDEHYEAYKSEAERQGVRVEALVQTTVNCLLRELEQEEEEGTDHPVIV